MAFRRLEDADLAGRRALVRVDFNLPMEDGRVTDDTRLRAALPTIRALSLAGARVVLIAHFDRPKRKRVPEMTLKPIVKPLSDLIEQPVAWADDCIGPDAAKVVDKLDNGGVALLENLRFHAGEEKDDEGFTAELAKLGDVFVNDAFSVAHRSAASVVGLAGKLPAYAGLAMQRELDMLDAALGNPKRPVLGIVGGSKVSTKLDLLNNLVKKLDRLAIGGGMANTFLAAQGHDVGGSLCEHDLADTAREIMATAKASGCELLLPVDVVTAEEVKPGVATNTRELGEVQASDRILDAGPRSVERLLAAMEQSATLIWNGPLGVFEVPPFDAATVAAAKKAGELAKLGRIVAVAGGGDTVAALNHAGVAGEFTFVSTAGGAFLEWMEGKELPGVAALQQG
ncbi:MAG TPA: phosphoglycerate kinase [Caulobacteraceae bacterium]|nr:phosphoglycerate kinase [Caulobacteraceae bacterium]